MFRRKRGILSPIQKNDEAYYIPLLDSLQQLLNDEFILAEVWQTLFFHVFNLEVLLPVNRRGSFANTNYLPLNKFTEFG